MKSTAKVREHPYTRPARQLRRGVEPRLTIKEKKTDRRWEDKEDRNRHSITTNERKETNTDQNHTKNAYW